MVVPFSAGGPTDTIGRIMAERMRGPLGQTVIVENVTGAAGTIGVGRVARAAPDGYTLSIGNWSTHVVNGAIYRCTMTCSTISSRSRCSPATRSWSSPSKAMPANNLQGVDRLAKANPDKPRSGPPAPARRPM